MTLTETIDLLNGIRPSREEIVVSLDSAVPDTELVNSICEMFDYQIVDFSKNELSLNSFINCTNIPDLGLGEFSFLPKQRSDFICYNEDGETYYFVNGKIEVQSEIDQIFIPCSEQEFIMGIIACFKANMDFAFRRSSFNKLGIIKFLEDMDVSTEKVQHFVEKIFNSYP